MFGKTKRKKKIYPKWVWLFLIFCAPMIFIKSELVTALIMGITVGACLSISVNVEGSTKSQFIYCTGITLMGWLIFYFANFVYPTLIG